jgi:hypothetical protein
VTSKTLPISLTGAGLVRRLFAQMPANNLSVLFRRTG